jgi:putative ABC transport system ATP-binding protein
METLISLRGVTKRYEGMVAPAIRDLDLDVEKGRITAVMGPSGCGKSTLLNLIGALDRPNGGEISLDGIRVDRLSETAAARFRRASVGFVFQFFHLLDDLSALDNVAIAAQLAGVSRAEARSRADAMLAELGLGEQRRKFPATLSGGERQRVAIARAIVNRPAVLLADEPTGALDRHNGDVALALLEDLNRRGQTILFVTHDEQLARRVADRIVSLVDGAITGDASTRLVA